MLLLVGKVTKKHGFGPQLIGQLVSFGSWKLVTRASKHDFSVNLPENQLED
jgi:hypothetical protein